MARSIVEEGDGAPSFRPLWMLMPYLWPKGQPELRVRVLASVFFLLLATSATSVSPLFYGWAVDVLAKTPAEIVLGAALSWIAAYTLSRILMQAFAQLRDGVFAKVQYHAMRKVAVSTFAHVHTLSLRFHLERKTGGLSRVIERGTKGIETIVRFTILNSVPTIIEFLLTAVIFWVGYGFSYLFVTAVTVALYIWFTVRASDWRISIRARKRGNSNSRLSRRSTAGTSSSLST